MVTILSFESKDSKDLEDFSYPCKSVKLTFGLPLSRLGKLQARLLCPRCSIGSCSPKNLRDLRDLREKIIRVNPCKSVVKSIQ